MRSITLIAFFCTLIRQIRAGFESPEIHLFPSHDTFVRRDRGDVYYGAASKITVTKRGANQRIGMMKFDTSEYNVKADGTEATLMLSVADSHDEAVQVKVYRLVSDFDEDHVNWDSFDGNVHTDQEVTFTVNNTNIDRMGEVNISKLLRDGKDVLLALVVDEGHVKFHSKDNEHELIPKLVLRPNEL